MNDPHVVCVFVRDGGEVLLLRPSDEVGSATGRWGTVAGHVEGDPDHTARVAIHEETGLTDEAITLVRAGDPFRVTDPETEHRLIVHSSLFDVATRAVTTTPETIDHEWVAPTEIPRRETVAGLWRSYERVSPTLETIETDRERGSAALSVSALRVLRDRAAVLADRAGSDGDGDHDDIGDGGEPSTDDPTSDDEWDELASLARALRAARPSMVVVRNRVNRAMTSADERGSRAVERAAQRAIDALVVGADTVFSDGSVLNKVGTRNAAIAAAHEGIPIYVVAASAKISPGSSTNTDFEVREGSELSPSNEAGGLNGESAIEVWNPTFDVTPVGVVSGICTERGVLAPRDVARVAEEFAAFAVWDEQ